MDSSVIKHMKELEEENRRLKKMYAKATSNFLTSIWTTIRSRPSSIYAALKG
jgi:hypothetical protein